MLLKRYVWLLCVCFSSSSVFSEDLRSWTSANGKHSVDATFQKLEGQTLHLERKDGKTFTVTLDKLDEESRQQALALSILARSLKINGKTASEWIERLRDSTDSDELRQACNQDMWERFASTCGEEEVKSLLEILGNTKAGDKAVLDVLAYLGPVVKHAEPDLLKVYFRGIKEKDEDLITGALSILDWIGASQDTCDALGAEFVNVNPTLRSEHGLLTLILAHSPWESSRNAIMALLKREAAKKQSDAGMPHVLAIMMAHRDLTLDSSLLQLLKKLIKDTSAEHYVHSNCNDVFNAIENAGPVMVPLANDILDVEQEPITRRLAIVTLMGPAAKEALQPYALLLNDDDVNVRQAAKLAFRAVGIRNVDKDTGEYAAEDAYTLDPVSLPWFVKATRSRVESFSDEELQHGAQLKAWGVSFSEVVDGNGGTILTAHISADKGPRYDCRSDGYTGRHGRLHGVDNIALSALRLLAAGPLRPERLELSGRVWDVHIDMLPEMPELKTIVLLDFSRDEYTPEQKDKLFALTGTRALIVNHNEAILHRLALDEEHKHMAVSSVTLLPPNATSPDGAAAGGDSLVPKEDPLAFMNNMLDKMGTSRGGNETPGDSVLEAERQRLGIPDTATDEVAREAAGIGPGARPRGDNMPSSWLARGGERALTAEQQGYVDAMRGAIRGPSADVNSGTMQLSPAEAAEVDAAIDINNNTSNGAVQKRVVPPKTKEEAGEFIYLASKLAKEGQFDRAIEILDAVLDSYPDSTAKKTMDITRKLKAGKK